MAEAKCPHCGRSGAFEPGLAVHPPRPSDGTRGRRRFRWRGAWHWDAELHCDGCHRLFWLSRALNGEAPAGPLAAADPQWRTANRR